MKKILVIDDNKDLAETIQSVLGYAGYTAIISHSGEEGLTLAKKERPDLIFLDILLPGMDGAEVISKLRENADTKDIPTIFLTGLMSDGDTSIEIKAQGIHVKSIAKPFENNKLLAIIKETLG